MAFLALCQLMIKLCLGQLKTDGLAVLFANPDIKHTSMRYFHDKLWNKVSDCFQRTYPGMKTSFLSLPQGDIHVQRVSDRVVCYFVFKWGIAMKERFM